MPRNTVASKIGNGVISLPRQLRCHCNPDHNKVSSLFNTTVVLIFPNLCLWQHSLRSNVGGIHPKKLYRATLIHWPTYRSSVQQHVNQQSTDMAIKSRSTYQPIVLHDTRPRGCTNYARSLICTNSKCKSVTKCTSAEFWVPVAQIMDRPVCSCQW